ncbi:odorant receptor 9a-like [Ptiloglossa arizonensis]|uniref:odorant receptor 9a-like n=1 Tax=Ptiloglossa arizonensis TaxID=3350558 RepID=UPI003FA155B9
MHCKEHATLISNLHFVLGFFIQSTTKDTQCLVLRLLSIFTEFLEAFDVRIVQRQKMSSEPLVAYNFLIYATDVVAFIYLYSYIGEQLMYESRKIGDAFYDINWPEVAGSDRKALLMCIMNGQRTMSITAGRFYTFSLFGFSGIMKTSMGGLSMLRANM